jgi:hypothetical protein
MKWQEVEKRYKHEWVFVEITKMDDDYEVLEGNVLIHDADDERFWKKVDAFEPDAHKRVAIRYIGEPPEDWAVML